MKGLRGLLIWSGLVSALALGLLVSSSGESERSSRAVAVASLGAVLGVAATRGLLRRAVCLVVAGLGAVASYTADVAQTTLGSLLATAGLFGVVSSAQWPGLARRYDSTGAARENGSEIDLWTRIERGDDPTD